MANTKKYVSLDKLSLYDEKIKAKIAAADATTLQAAKDFASGLADNYEPSGAVKTAKEELQGKIDVVQGNVDTVSAAQVATQGEVDALETLVGKLPEGTTAKDVVDYVNVKTAGIATDAALSELNGQVSGLQTTVQGISADYLKSTDKTELSDAIAEEASRADKAEKANAAAIDAIEADYLKAADKEALEGSISGVAGDVATIKGDYLKASDKTELNTAIGKKADQTALDAEVTRATQAEESLQTQINTIMNNPETEGVIDSINEFTQYITEHGAIAEGFRTDIDKNKSDIAAEVKRAGEAEAALDERLDVLEAIDHAAYVAADTALKTELNTAIGKKADQTALESAVQALEGADAGQIERIEALEGKLGTGDDSVSALIATAKQEAIDAATAAAATDATSKANTAEGNAKTYADGLNTAMNTRMEAVEGKAHEHSNKALLDTYTQTEANLADAVAKKHEHSNLSVLEGITSAKVTAWDAAEGNAKTFATGLNTAMDGRVTALETWHTDFVECSQEDINGLFA